MNGGLGVKNAGSVVDTSDCLNRGNRGPHEDRLEFVTPTLGERADVAEASACPCPKRDFVDRCVEGHSVAFVADDSRSGGSETAKSMDERGGPDLKVGWPAPVSD